MEQLKELIARWPDYLDSYPLLGELYEKSGRTDAAVELYRQALAREGLSPEDRHAFQARLRRLGSGR